MKLLIGKWKGLIDMHYVELVSRVTKPDLKPFDHFTHFGATLNGYVVIPDQMPLDYYSVVYQDIDTTPIGGLTFGGYFTEINGELSCLYLDAWPTYDPNNFSKEELEAIESINKLSVRAIGFDNNHIWTNEMGAEDGAEYLSEELKKIKVV